MFREKYGVSSDEVLLQGLTNYDLLELVLNFCYTRRNWHSHYVNPVYWLAGTCFDTLTLLECATERQQNRATLVSVADSVNESAARDLDFMLGKQRLCIGMTDMTLYKQFF